MKGIGEFGVRTVQSLEFVDITGQVRDYLSSQSVDGGILVVYTPHTTAGITINENADPAVTMDISEFMKRKFPQENYFRHMEGNSPSHIMSSMFSASETLLVDGGELVLGTWQGIYFCEFDGPRSRKVYLKLIKDK